MAFAIYIGRKEEENKLWTHLFEGLDRRPARSCTRQLWLKDEARTYMLTLAVVSAVGGGAAILGAFLLMCK